MSEGETTSREEDSPEPGAAGSADPQAPSQWQRRRDAAVERKGAMVTAIRDLKDMPGGLGAPTIHYS